jgi:hypothetical protein
VAIPELQLVAIASVSPRHVQALVRSKERPEAVVPVKEPPLVISIGKAVPQANRGPISSAPPTHIQAKSMELNCMVRELAGLMKWAWKALPLQSQIWARVPGVMGFMSMHLLGEDKTLMGPTALRKFPVAGRP